MRGRRTISPSAAAVEFVPRDYFAPLDLRELFARDAPLEVDIGCGDGGYLAALAQRNPRYNFLGIERLAGRVRSACNKIAQRQLDNARVLLVEASYAVAYLLPAQSIAAFHVLFSDPWPKRRHERRRLLDRTFFESIARALAPRGTVYIATDQREYFDDVCETASLLFSIADAPANPAASTFERRYEERGALIYRILLRKTSRVR